MNSRKRVGLIGCGNIWRIVYQPIFAAVRERMEITAFCDLSPVAARNAAALLPEARRYDDPIALFREESLDAVVVLTHEKANATVAEAALRAGLSVFLEKPPAVSIAEWQQLTKVADEERGQIYTAFNRRHTPLFREWSLPAGVPLRSVRGALTRQGRAVDTFPYTAVHLLDSVQFFAGELLTEYQITFSDKKPRAGWNIRGRLAGGATCDLTFLPDDPDQAEYLWFETADWTWKLHFPNGAYTKNPSGLLVSESHVWDSTPIQISGIEHGDQEADHLEAAGYAPCFRDFLHRLENDDWGASPHGLHRCGATIAILEEMLASVRHAAGKKTAFTQQDSHYAKSI